MIYVISLSSAAIGFIPIAIGGVACNLTCFFTVDLSIIVALIALLVLFYLGFETF